MALLLDDLPATPPVSPLHYYYNLGRDEHVDPDDDIDRDQLVRTYAALVGRAMLPAVAAYSASQVAGYAWGLEDPDWDVAAGRPALRLAFRHSWIEFRAPLADPGVVGACPALSGAFPRRWGWLADEVDGPTFAGLAAMNGLGDDVPGTRGLSCCLIAAYGGDNPAQSYAVPMCTALLPLDDRHRLSGSPAYVPLFELDESKVHDPDLFRIMVDVLFRPFFLTIGLWSLLGQTDMILPPKKVVAKRRAAGKLPPKPHRILDPAAAVNLLRMKYHAGIVGLPRAFADLAGSTSGLILPGDINPR